MSNLPATLSGMSIESLAELANDAAGQVEQHGRKTVTAAMAAGQALRAAKEQIEHGAWEAWLKQNFLYSLRTARQYMQAAEKWQHAAVLQDATSVRQVLAYIGDNDEGEAVKTAAEQQDGESAEPERVAAETTSKPGSKEPSLAPVDNEGHDWEAADKRIAKFVRREFQKVPREYWSEVEKAFVEAVNEVKFGTL
jgi:hypothetical protein